MIHNPWFYFLHKTDLLWTEHRSLLVCFVLVIYFSYFTFYSLGGDKGYEGRLSFISVDQFPKKIFGKPFAVSKDLTPARPSTARVEPEAAETLCRNAGCCLSYLGSGPEKTPFPTATRSLERRQLSGVFYIASYPGSGNSPTSGCACRCLFWKSRFPQRPAEDILRELLPCASECWASNRAHQSSKQEKRCRCEHCNCPVLFYRSIHQPQKSRPRQSVHANGSWQIAHSFVPHTAEKPPQIN